MVKHVTGYCIVIFEVYEVDYEDEDYQKEFVQNAVDQEELNPFPVGFRDKSHF